MIFRLETYKAKLLQGTPLALEHAEMKWVIRDNLHKLDFAPADIPAVEKISKEK